MFKSIAGGLSTAHGQELLNIDRGVVIDQGNGAAAFDGRDLVPGSAVGGWVPWNAAMHFVAR